MIAHGKGEAVPSVEKDSRVWVAPASCYTCVCYLYTALLVYVYLSTYTDAPGSLHAQGCVHLTTHTHAGSSFRQLLCALFADLLGVETSVLGSLPPHAAQLAAYAVTAVAPRMAAAKLRWRSDGRRHSSAEGGRLSAPIFLSPHGEFRIAISIYVPSYSCWRADDTAVAGPIFARADLSGQAWMPQDICLVIARL